MAEELSGVAFDAVYSSDLLRCLQTAEIIAARRCRRSPRPDTGLPVRREPRLREINTGLWEGLTDAEARLTYPQDHAERERDLIGYPFPGGESFRELQRRAVAAFHDLLAADAVNVLAVAHRGVNRVLLCHLLRLPLDRLFSFRQDYGCINLVRASLRPDGSFEFSLTPPD